MAENSVQSLHVFACHCYGNKRTTDGNVSSRAEWVSLSKWVKIQNLLSVHLLYKFHRCKFPAARCRLSPFRSPRVAVSRPCCLSEFTPYRALMILDQGQCFHGWTHFSWSDTPKTSKLHCWSYKFLQIYCLQYLFSPLSVTMKLAKSCHIRVWTHCWLQQLNRAVCPSTPRIVTLLWTILQVYFHLTAFIRKQQNYCTICVTAPNYNAHNMWWNISCCMCAWVMHIHWKSICMQYCTHAACTVCVDLERGHKEPPTHPNAYFKGHLSLHQDQLYRTIIIIDLWVPKHLHVAFKVPYLQKCPQWQRTEDFLYRMCW